MKEAMHELCTRVMCMGAKCRLHALYYLGLTIEGA